MKTVQLQSEVGNHGVLALSVPLGADEAGHRVNVTIEQISISGNSREEWLQFIEDTYGSCAGLGLERPGQGVLESREASNDVDARQF